MNNNCVYFHINPVKNQIFYVGIGNEKRPFSKQNRNKFWNNTVKKYNYVVDITETNLSWTEACEREKFYISKLGRKNLVNLTDGGEGQKGFKHSEESRKKISQVQIGRKHTEQSKLNMSLSKKGMGSNRTKEHQEKLNASLKRWVENNKEFALKKMADCRSKQKPATKETREKMSKAHNGFKHSEESKQKISKKNLGKKRDNIFKSEQSERIKKLWENPEYRERMILALKNGKKNK